jgi:hypothetical protein
MPRDRIVAPPDIQTRGEGEECERGELPFGEKKGEASAPQPPPTSGSNGSITDKSREGESENCTCNAGYIATTASGLRIFCRGRGTGTFISTMGLTRESPPTRLALTRAHLYCTSQGHGRHKIATSAVADKNNMLRGCSKLACVCKRPPVGVEALLQAPAR